MNTVLPQSAPVAAESGCDPAKLAAIGHRVRRALASVPAAVRVPTDGAEIYTIDGFLAPRDRKEMVRIINSEAVPSTLYKGTGGTNLRTSHTHHFRKGHPLVEDIERYICEITGLDILHAEPLQGQRYQQGQEFRHHHDWFHLGEGYWRDEAPRGGQRSWTAMIFLNEPRAGGETDFPHLGLRFAPKAGQMLLWNNMTAQGGPNRNTLHAGLPVTRGIKHIVTWWFRQEPWRLLNSRS